MLRATITHTANGKALKIEGKLSGPWVDEVHRLWVSLQNLRGAGALEVGLEDVTFADSRGADLLLKMRGQGASLVGCSNFLTHLLQDGVHEDPARGKSQTKSQEG
jgi:ABC-type transporter Mla MlaB component